MKSRGHVTGGRGFKSGHHHIMITLGAYSVTTKGIESFLRTTLVQMALSTII